jgi:hypothetical protein
VFNHQLKGMRLIRSHTDSGSQVYWAVFGHGITPRLSPDDDRDAIDVRCGRDAPKGCGHDAGRDGCAAPDDWRWVVPLSQDPIYIQLR